MSDRGVFVATFLTVVLIVAGAFALPQLFFFDLAKSTIYIAIGVLVFFGEDRYSYMLGMIAPLLWFLADILFGGLFRDFAVLVNYLEIKPVGILDTPLHGAARLTAILLVILSYRAWRKEVPERFFGKTFGICLAISLAYAIVVGAWYYLTFSQVAAA
jgi:hypothetical protein